MKKYFNRKQMSTNVCSVHMKDEEGEGGKKACLIIIAIGKEIQIAEDLSHSVLKMVVIRRMVISS
jgi:hypothetical protein